MKPIRDRFAEDITGGVTEDGHVLVVGGSLIDDEGYHFDEDGVIRIIHTFTEALIKMRELKEDEH